MSTLYRRFAPRLYAWPAAAVMLFVCSATAPASAGSVTLCASAGLDGKPAGGAYVPAISADGRYAAFASVHRATVANDATAWADILLRDLAAGATEMVSVSSDGAQGNSDSVYPSISGDGRYIAFTSAATNLTPGDTNGKLDVFVRDRLAGTTERVSIATDGTQANGSSHYASISGDGRYVAFQTSASNLVPDDANAALDILVRDRLAGTTERVSVSTLGVQGNGASTLPRISLDGAVVTFQSVASNLVPGDTNGCSDVFVYDRSTATIERASVSAAGAQSEGPADGAAISSDGRYVSFTARAANLAPGLHTGVVYAFLRDRQVGTTECVSVTIWSPTDFVRAEPGSTAVSGDGRTVAFFSRVGLVTWEVPPANAGYRHLFVRDRVAGTTELMSIGYAGGEGNADSEYPSISTDGRYVAFQSWASNLVPNDMELDDVFVRVREAPALTVATPTSARIGETITLAATLADEVDGSPQAGETIRFEVDLRLIGTATTGTDGRAEMPYLVTEGAGAGYRTVRATHASSQESRPAAGSASLSVTKGIPAFSLFAARGVPGQKVTLRSLMMCGGTPIVGRWVLFYVDGAYAGGGTSAADGVKVDYVIPPSLTPGAHELRVAFGPTADFPDSAYVAAKRAADALTVTGKGNVVFSLYPVTGAIGQKVTLRSLMHFGGYPLAGKPVRFHVDGAYVGTAVSGTQDVRLDYTIPQTLAPGLHNVTVTFEGDDALNPATRTTAALTVTKGAVGFSLYPARGAPGQTVTLRALMLNGGQPVVGRTVHFFVDDAYAGSAVSGTGGVLLEYLIPAGTVPGPRNVTVFFLGDSLFLSAQRTAAALTVQ